MGDAVAMVVSAGKAILNVGLQVASNPVVQQVAVTAGSIAIANALRPETPSQQMSIPVRHRRPVRFTGTGRLRLAGATAFFHAYQRFGYDVYLLHDGRVDGFEDWYLDDDLVTVTSDVVQAIGTKYEFGCVELQWREGLATETNYADLTTAVTSAVWPSTARGDGIASVYKYLAMPTPEYVSSRLPNGDPMVRVTARLSRVYDPREASHDADDPDTWEWSANAILGLLFYLCFHESGPRLDYRRKVLPVLEYWKRAADVCDEEVAQREGGAAARYEAHVGWNWDVAPSGVIGEYLTCCDGWMAADSQGRLKIYAGKLYPPAVVLTDAHVRGWTLTRGRRAETRADALEISYRSPDHQLDMVATDPWPDRETFAMADGEAGQPLTLSGVETNSQARRLGKRYFKKRNAEASGTLLVDLLPDDGTDVMGERYLRLALGASAPRILQHLILEVQDIEMDVMTGLASISWIAVDRDIDDWDPDTEEGAGPDVAEDAAAAYAAPEITDVSAELVIVEEPATNYYRILVEAPDVAAAATWEIRYRITGTVGWTIQTAIETDLGATVELRTGSVPDGETCDVQIRYLDSGGDRSAWGETPILTVVVPGL